MVAPTTDSGDNATIALQLARFACALDLGDVPAAVQERALYSILDSIGVALAAGRSDFATRAAEAIATLSAAGSVPVLGLPLRFGMRDAALLNGVLIHGLDYDDTLLQAAVHPTASLLPVILSVGHDRNSSGREMLTAYIVGLETIARLGMFGGIALREAGFHPTSVIGIFGCAAAAARLFGLTPEQNAMAQGIALAMSSGTVGSDADGAFNKRLHPGWAAQAAITAAALARAGLPGIAKAYEGPRGLFRSLDTRDASSYQALSHLMANLGLVWESGNISTKPIPACHLTHACSDAAVQIRAAHRFTAHDIESVTAFVPKGTVTVVCEPVAAKRRPVNAYAAQFSIPYVVAASLVRGRFTFAELEPDVIADPHILALAARVGYAIDDASTYPVHRTGEVHVTLKDGTKLRHREAINRGHPDRPLPVSDIAAKFHANAALSNVADQAQRIESTVLNMATAGGGRALADALCAHS